ncbi:exodeoxyribonuclease V [Flavobacteriaceae bacterium UJ101]|nr:exodeoxyribonuclease V [Flavobacteriaceae bacterium UJ101]
MTIDAIKSELLSQFNFDPTKEQYDFFERFSKFMVQLEQEVFILKGYAGTGKTSLTKAIVKTLRNTKYNVILLAPTGRAAKVLGNYSGKKAFTIHSHIYHVRNGKNGTEFILKKNKLKNTLFIIDEASMITNQAMNSKGMSGGVLMDDLFQYVFQLNSKNKILFIGDVAQLPPVHLEISPALDQNYLNFNYCKEVQEFKLTEVVRQEEDSTIVKNATRIREFISERIYDLQLNVSDNDFERFTDRYDVEAALAENLTQNLDETLIVVRSNKRANLYNEQIRQRILLRDGVLEKGDKLMVLKNNYFWLDETSKPGFIANGEVIEIKKVRKIIELYGFQFAEVKISLPDYPEEPDFNTVLLLDTIHAETSGLTYEQSNQLYEKVIEDYEDEPTKYKRFKKVKENPYFNALQVKYAYAVTCHKAQGGQWDHVFVEQPYTEQIDENYLRWIYTAFTRAKKKIYLLGFKEEYFV